MSRPKALIKEEIPENVIGAIAIYLQSQCDIPGCSAVFHLDDAKAVVQIIIDYNKNKGEK